MAVNNSLARQGQSMKLSVYLQNDAVKKQINQVVGGKNGTRFISSIVSAVQNTPALQECTSPSIVNAALLGEALNLSPSPQLGQFYMVPFDNKKKHWYSISCRFPRSKSMQCRNLEHTSMIRNPLKREKKCR